MKEFQFIETRRADWEAWDRWLQTSARRSLAWWRQPRLAERPFPADELPKRFRGLCQDLSLARDRRYSEPLVNALQARTLAAYQRVYGARRPPGNRLRFILHDLPVLVRDEWRVVSASAALFFVPLIMTILLLQWLPDGAYLLLSPETVGEVESMYAPGGAHLGRPRGADDDVMLLGYYIANNVRIDFQCFAGGVVFALGSLFFLIFNGLMIGAIAGHLTHLGYIETFWGFVAGHSAPELLGIVLSGASGLKLGWALAAPGRLPRMTAIRRAVPNSVRLLYGAAGLTFGAAFVEAFWSPLRTFPVEIKYAFGIAFWAALLAYFILVGRSRHAI